MAYKPQYGPGQTQVAENRRKQMDPNHKLAKLRDVSDKDIVLMMGHRAPGSAYKSAHPPLAEQQEPNCPIRKLVTPTDGAKAGDRVRYIQFSDSMYNAPCQPYQRSYLEAYRFRGIDPGTLSGRQIIECRERDLEKYARDLVNTELFDAALTGIRGCTVHGHSLRLDENGMMFDMLQRCCPRQEVRNCQDRQGPGRCPAGLRSQGRQGNGQQVAQGKHHDVPLPRRHRLPRRPRIR